MAAAFSRHLAAASDHLAAAARHLAGAAREHGEVDIEASSSSSSSSSSDAGGDGDGGSTSASAGSGAGAGGDDADGDFGDNVETILSILGHVYEWIGLLTGTVLPVPVYFILPKESRASAAWTWSLLAYAFAFSIGVTFVSVRVFRSACCLCTTLRALLLAACLLIEIFAAFRLLPTTLLTTIGAVLSIMHLLFFYLVAWKLSPPRSRRRRR